MFAVLVLIVSAMEGLVFMGAAERGLYDSHVWALGLVVAAILVLSFVFSGEEKDENKENAQQGFPVNSGGTIMFAGYCLAVNVSVLISIYWLAHDPYYGAGRLVAVLVPFLIFVSPLFLALFFLEPSKQKAALPPAEVTDTTLPTKEELPSRE